MILLLSVRLLDDRYHGLTANGEKPEWPPSPFRLFQALVAGNANGSTLKADVAEALRWLESLNAPDVIAPRAGNGQTIQTYVLNNTDGRSRTPKIVRPTILNGDRLIQYAWKFDPNSPDAIRHAGTIATAARHIRALGWGIDMANGHGEIVDAIPRALPSRIRFLPIQDLGMRASDFRSPRLGSLTSLEECYSQYLARFESNESTQLESGGPIYQLQAYTAGGARPYAIFKLLDANDDPYRHPHSKLVHIAGMVRHLAISAMTRNPPPSVKEPATWIKRYVAGHRDAADKAVDLPHAQLSYVPLPSIGHHHTDPAVRRVMIVAPVGDDAILEHLSQQLDGLRLEPEGQQDLRVPVFLHRARHDNVGKFYTQPDEPENYGYSRWASVTPVILPGHDDHKPEKTRKLIEKALVQSGIDQPCEFEWSAFSHFPKSYSAHKYDKSKRLIGYIRPDHLIDQTAVHLTLMFPLGLKVPGPLTIGAGRHCGFGLMAGIGD